jgi:hypothetical protein
VAADKLVNLQGKRATSDDLSDLNKSLEFYEDAVNAYSSSVKDMWDRNIRLALGPESGEGTEDDVSLLFGAAGTAPAVDEETETLFIEEQETVEEPVDEEYLDPQEDFLPPSDDMEISLDTMADQFAPLPPLFPSPPVPVPPGPQSPEEAPPEEPAAGETPAAEPAPAQPSEPVSPPPRPPESAPVPPPPAAAEPFPSEPAAPEPAAPESADFEPADFEAAAPESADFEPPPPKPANPVEPPPPWPPQPYPPPPPYYPPPPAGPIEEEAPFPGTGPRELPGNIPFDDEDTEAIFTEEEEPEPLPEPEDASPSTSQPPPPEEPEPPEEDSSLPAPDFPPEGEDASPPAPDFPPEEEDASSPVPPSSPVLGLMHYLKALAEALPDDARREYMQSQARLSMERIIDTLEGRRGPGETDAAAGDLSPAAGSSRRGGKMAALRAAAYAKDAADRAAGRQKKPKKPDLTGMLAFIAKLAAAAPNANLGKTISHKVGTVLSGLKKPEKDGERRG